MSLAVKLKEVQSKLKAPKGQFNKFGNYKYRSCEDILEAVKPLLAEVGAIIIISDELVCVEGRHYVKAQATFIDSPSIDSTSLEKDSVGISVSAFAREALEQKGMSESQITGSASSYARKYALNGLLLIDDTKENEVDHANPPDDKPAQKLDPKIKAQIDLAIDLQSLSDVWNSIPAGLRHGYTEAKNARKAHLEGK
jgi:hypothetical protein